MSNVVIAAKRFLQNKNVVTLIGVVVIVLILYFLYNYQIQTQVQPQNIPVAKEAIQPGTEITTDMIKWIKVPAAAVSSNVLKATNSIVGKYTNYNTEIPAGSMFYSDVLVSKSDLPDSVFTQVKEGDVVYNLAVNTSTTYGNSMLPGNFIDLYMKATDDSGQVMVGKLIENVEVLAVKDSSGKNVFESSSETRTPAYLIFGVSQEIHILLRKAEYMGKNSIVIIPVPHGSQVTASGTEATVSSTYLKEFINSKTVIIPEESSTTTTSTTSTSKSTSTSTTKGA